MGFWLAALSGAVAGGALLVGAAIAWFVTIPQRVVAAVMAVGAGVLISTLAFELVQEGNEDGGLLPTVIGFAVGALLYVGADAIISRPHNRKPAANIVARRSASTSTGTSTSTSTSAATGGNGTVIAVGALIDGIPEAIVMGLSVIATGGLSLPIVAAVAISNIPEGLGSTAELKRSGASARRVFGLWSVIAAVTVVAACVGFLAFQAAPPELTAVVTTVAAGALLAMVCSTMIPEAFEEQHILTGLWATLGFLGAFILHEIA